MRRRVLTAVFLSTAIAVAVPLPASAVEDPAADKLVVRYIAGKDPRSLVRASAWAALLSDDPDATVAEFLATGFDYSKGRAAQAKQRNIDFCKRVLATNTVAYAPEVNAAARRAVNGSDADRENFVRTGYAAAQQRDRLAREANGEQARALVEADWAYVRDLAANDPGTQVRASAAWATRTGATESDLVEFFAYGWASGARLDLETFRLRNTDNDMLWRAQIITLITDARAAEQAAREAEPDIAEQAKAAAIRAWQAVGTKTDPARSMWTDAQQLTQQQAATWAAVAAAALAASGPNWAAMVDPALANESEWASEQEFAAQQARYWQGLLQQAHEGEERVLLGA